jgi:hypothetical protein
MRFHMDAMLAASPPAPNKRDAATRVRYIFLEGHHGQKNKDQEAVPAGRLFFRRFQSLRGCIRRTSYKAGRSGAEPVPDKRQSPTKRSTARADRKSRPQKRSQSAQQADDNPPSTEIPATSQFEFFGPEYLPTIHDRTQVNSRMPKVTFHLH